MKNKLWTCLTMGISLGLVLASGSNSFAANSDRAEDRIDGEPSQSTVSQPVAPPTQTPAGVSSLEEFERWRQIVQATVEGHALQAKPEARMQRLDAVSQNLANDRTTGFKDSAVSGMPAPFLPHVIPGAAHAHSSPNS